MSSSSTIIAKGAFFEGNLDTHGNLRIEGNITGNVKCKSKVAMGDSSVVSGNIITQNAEIAGTIKGQIEVADLLILKTTAVVEGDIVAGKIIVESGAVFNGKCKMGAIVKDITIGEGKNYNRDFKTA